MSTTTVHRRRFECDRCGATNEGPETTELVTMHELPEGWMLLLAGRRRDHYEIAYDLCMPCANQVRSLLGSVPLMRQPLTFSRPGPSVSPDTGDTLGRQGRDRKTEAGL